MSHIEKEMESNNKEMEWNDQDIKLQGYAII